MLISYREVNFEFYDIFRVIISGNSGAGKTFFTKRLLESGHIENISRVSYHHPDSNNNTRPVDWHLGLRNRRTGQNIDTVYRVGLPDSGYIESLPPYAVLVIDDLYQEAIDSYPIDQLLRVHSGKRNLHVILLTQQYYCRGRYSVSIRNCCRYHVLLQTNDYGSNKRVAAQFNLKTELETAEKYNKYNPFPYFFVVRGHLARTNQLACFVNIFDNDNHHLTAIKESMVYYLISKTDFDHLLERRDDNVAALRSTSLKNEDKKRARDPARDPATGLSTSSSSTKPATTTPPAAAESESESRIRPRQQFPSIAAAVAATATTTTKKKKSKK